MDWLIAIGNLIAHIPFERVLFPPRDKTKTLEEFAAGLKHTESPKEAPGQQKPISSIAIKPEVHVEAPEVKSTAVLPTREETTQELKRRLGKELYKAELDLSSKLRIAGKPCDCLDAKHTLGLEAAAEELIAQEPSNPVYSEIIGWIKRNQSKVAIEAIMTGKYDTEYPKMAAEFKDFRKRVLGTTALRAMVQPGETLVRPSSLDEASLLPTSEEPVITLEEAQKIAAAEAAEEVKRRWRSQEKKPAT